MDQVIYDVAVIGGGVTGGFTARELSRYRLKTVLLESGSDVASGASRANSAIVHAGFDAKPGTVKAKLGLRGSEMMETLTKELGVPYRRNGSLVIGDEDELPMIEMLYDRGIQNGVKDMEIIGEEKLRALEPNVAPQAKHALWAKTGAITCAFGLAIAAVGNAMDNGVDLRCNFTVNAATRMEDGSFRLTSKQGETVYARRVVNAAGTHADEIASLFGDTSFRITARRGEYYIFDKEYGCMFGNTIFRAPSKMGKGIIISPTVHGNLLLGPTAHDTDQKDDTTTTAEGLREMAQASVRYCERIPFRNVITTFCGVRPVPDSGDFIISRPVEGFVNAAGIESPGLTASPAIAEEVVKLLCEDGLELIPNENFVPTRKPYDWFRNLTEEQKNEIIRMDPSFGKIVCRCEGITEGEILYAIRQNPKPQNMDAVKLRTRAGMGRCQGGFCSPSVMKMLAQEQNTFFTNVEKHGNGSYMVSKIVKGGC